MDGKDEAIVVDSSFVLNALLPDEQSLLATNLFDRYSLGECVLVSSPLLLFEVINGIKMSVARRRMNRERAESLIKGFLELKIKLVEMDAKKLFSLACQENLTVYDASYLLVSKENNYPLLSRERRRLRRKRMEVN